MSGTDKTPLDMLTAGRVTTEHRITWAAIILGAVVILGQIVGTLFLGVDLGVDVDHVLMLITGGGAAYTVGRTGVKMATAYVEGRKL